MNISIVNKFILPFQCPVYQPVRIVLHVLMGSVNVLKGRQGLTAHKVGLSSCTSHACHMFFQYVTHPALHMHFPLIRPALEIHFTCTSRVFLVCDPSCTSLTRTSHALLMYFQSVTCAALKIHFICTSQVFSVFDLSCTSNALHVHFQSISVCDPSCTSLALHLHLKCIFSLCILLHLTCTYH